MKPEIVKFPGTFPVTGNNPSPAVKSTSVGREQTVAMRFTAGATPTVTITIQGSFDGGTGTPSSWSTIPIRDPTVASDSSVLTLVKTATGWVHAVITAGWWKYIRISLSANLNMTLEEAWLVESSA